MGLASRAHAEVYIDEKTCCAPASPSESEQRRHAQLSSGTDPIRKRTYKKESGTDPIRKEKWNRSHPKENSVRIGWLS